MSDDRAIEVLAEAMHQRWERESMAGPLPYTSLPWERESPMRKDLFRGLVQSGVEALASAGFQITDQALVAQEREAREKAEAEVRQLEVRERAERRLRDAAAADESTAILERRTAVVRCAELEAERLTQEEAELAKDAIEFFTQDREETVEEAPLLAKLRARASSPSGEERREET